MIYKYKAISQDGQTIEGRYRSESRDNVISMLNNQGYIPIAVEEDRKTRKRRILLAKRVSRRDLAIFCRQFHILIKGGISIVKSLDILVEQTKNTSLKGSVEEVLKDIQKGYTLSQSMDRHRKVFPEILINMVQAGELSGSLDIILKRMSIYFEKESKLESKIKSSMTYPIILIVTSIIVIFFILTVVLPIFISIFTHTDIILPWPTRALLTISIYLKSYWYLLPILTIIISSFIYYYKNSSSGKRKIDRIKVTLPIIKNLNINIIISRFSRTLATLISSGIPLIQALTIVSKVLNNKEIEARLIGRLKSLEGGMSLSQMIEGIGIFPSIVNSMIHIGEESGSLDEILHKTADFYDTEVEENLNRLTSLIEPVLLILMSIIIGFIVMSITLPMFDMVNII